VGEKIKELDDRRLIMCHEKFGRQKAYQKPPPGENVGRDASSYLYFVITDFRW